MKRFLDFIFDTFGERYCLYERTGHCQTDFIEIKMWSLKIFKKEFHREVK